MHFVCGYKVPKNHIPSHKAGRTGFLKSWKTTFFKKLLLTIKFSFLYFTALIGFSTKNAL